METLAKLVIGFLSSSFNYFYYRRSGKGQCHESRYWSILIVDQLVDRYLCRYLRSLVGFGLIEWVGCNYRGDADAQHRRRAAPCPERDLEWPHEFRIVHRRTTRLKGRHCIHDGEPCCAVSPWLQYWTGRGTTNWCETNEWRGVCF